ncbi:hypothetical protein SLS62_003393 [Diatrype stigma]|uniref:Uncharacterized protein n=1 Tax=Diatrype stigma TaxID=117547 RepID=A0AAN9YUP3_9PEZI
MKASPFIVAGLGVDAAQSKPQPREAQPPQVPSISMLQSTVSRQCAPGISINVDVQPEHLAFHLPALSFGTTGHGRTDEYAACDLDVDFDSWFYKWRFAIADVTYSGRANLTNGVRIAELTARADFRYIHREHVGQPEVRNLSQTKDGLWDSVHACRFVCGAMRCLFCDKGEGQFAEGGLTVTFGLAWEECIPDRSAKYAWGESRTDEWETCTYKDTAGNESTLSTRALPRDVSLRHGLDVRAAHARHH